MENKIKHLYIHIPFCKQICTYCDFYRTKTQDNNLKNTYIQKIVDQIKKDNNLYKTIYIGGGTPNYLEDKTLDLLLSSLKPKLDNNFEFTIECNPEFVNQSQIDVFKKNHINRISLGIQTLNETILKLLKRTHNNLNVYNALNLLKKNNINNVSIDLIYNLPFLKNEDILQSFKLISKYNIKHVSFYSLEIKEGSIMNKMNYKIDTEIEEDQLDLICKEFEKLNYERYEISNWAYNNQFYSNHNLAYWNLDDWKAIGVSGYGLENNIYYKNEGNIDSWKKVDQKWTKKDFYENIFIMGLRKKDGIDLNIKKNYEAFLFLKPKLNFELLEIKNNFIKAKNIDLLNDILLDII